MRSISMTIAGLVFAAAGSANAAILYSSAVETANRFNPGLNALGAPVGPPSQQDITFDDIPIANASAFGQVSITKVTYGIRRLANAPAVDLNFFAATVTTPVAPQTLSDGLDFPFISLGSVSLAANGAASVTQLVVQDFTSSPILVNLNPTLFAGTFGTLALGLQFSNADANNGWRVATPSAGSSNANQLGWLYDTDRANAKNAFSFGVPSATVPPTTFYVILEGNLVPAPASAALLGLGGLVAARRRRN